MTTRDFIEPVQPQRGMDGTLRLMAILAVLTAAGLGSLVVLEVIDLSAMGELSKKLALLMGIVVAASVAVWAIGKPFRR